MKKAIIFDMDGVISDTQKMHSDAWSRILNKYGINIAPKEVTLRFAGMSAREAFTDLLSEYGLERFLDVALKDKSAIIKKSFDKKIKPIKGVKVLINKLIKEGRDIAVATGSGHKGAHKVLKDLGLEEVFPVVVTSDDVSVSKPAPDIFLLAAKKLGRDPAECVVIEDSRNGMVAAHLAGMKCIGLVMDRNAVDVYPADKLVEGYGELSAEDFE